MRVWSKFGKLGHRWAIVWAFMDMRYWAIRNVKCLDWTKWLDLKVRPCRSLGPIRKIEPYVGLWMTFGRLDWALGLNQAKIGVNQSSTPSVDLWICVGTQLLIGCYFDVDRIRESVSQQP